MYAQYWGLVDTPFENSVDGRWFYESPIHEEALARLLFLIEHQRRCGVLFGPAGTGKSIVLEVLSHQIRRTQRQLASVDLVGMSAAEMLSELAGALGLAPKSSESQSGLWRMLQDHLHGSEAAQIQTIFLLDHLERADSDCLSHLERLSHFHSSHEQWTTLILGVRSESLPELAPLLREISDLRIELPKLDRLQTHLYVETLLERAGRKSTIFDNAALERLYDLSRGLPCELNRLCDLSLLAAMAEGEKTVSDETIAGVADDLQLVKTGNAGSPVARFRA